MARKSVDTTTEVRDPTLSIVSAEISNEMRKSFIEYSMSVITGRALPDVRDGLKPVHRRILYGMYKMGLTPGSKFKKSAAVVGEVLGKYHPHGDISVYDAMVKMAQTFSYRCPLVLGQGNFGSLDGDGAAAMRYTEAKMSKIGELLLRDIEKDTVTFGPNYDGAHQEPTVLPAAVPALLLNGVLGIAVGMASAIPPHNPGEVMDAVVHALQNPDATTDDLLQFVKGPDFPGGGIAYNISDIATAYRTGRGGVVTRGEVSIEQSKGGKAEIVITSIPYQVNRADLIIKIADLVNDKKVKGIRDIRDESTDSTRIVIEVRSGFIPEKILNYLYKHTELQTNFNYNMTALVDGVPQTLSLADAIHAYCGHRIEIVQRRTRFDLNRALDRAHILEGLSKALDHIDEIIALIKKSPDTETAKQNLIKKFSFTEIQSIAILDMKLQRLAGLERQKIEDELNEKRKLIKELQSILDNEKKLRGVLIDETLEIRTLIDNPRRTTIVKRALGEFTEEDMVPDTDVVVVLTADGYIKRTDPSEFRAQRRGGIGVGDLDTKEDDVVTHALVGRTHSELLFFTNQGKVYGVKMYDIPEGRRATKGKSIQNFLSLATNEQVTSVLELPKSAKGEAEKSLMLVTKKGQIKRTALSHVANLRKSGLIIIGLDAGDDLLGAYIGTDMDELMIVSATAQSIRFALSDVRTMGRGAGGVRGMTLDKNDFVIAACVIPMGSNGSLLVVSEYGYGKKTEIAEYRIQGRGGSGITTFNTTDKTGNLVGAAFITTDTGEVITMSQKSQVVRVSVSEIPTLGRSTQGVRIMKVREGDKLASIAVIGEQSNA